MADNTTDTLANLTAKLHEFEALQKEATEEVAQFELDKKVDVVNKQLKVEKDYIKKQQKQRKKLLDDLEKAETEKDKARLKRKLDNLNAEAKAAAENIEKAANLQKKLDNLKERGLDGKLSKAKAYIDTYGAKDSLAIGLTSLVNSIANMSQQMMSKADQIAQYQSAIDTRLYGSSTNKTFMGSYFRSLSKDVTGLAGISPLISQENFMSNIATMVSRGIAFNIEQRAAMETLKDKIATTFSSFDSSLIKLIRIQQADTTAGRLGMEAALNEFLNSMYSTTEYMTDAASDIRSSIYEASALMGATQATAFEFQVQKWMGSMYSVGMSREGIQGIASALGKLSAGDISGLTGGGASNLLIMAANKAGLSIGDILNNSLNAENTNKLLAGVVSYLGELGSSSSSLVTRQQLARVFGLSASDLKAISNLSEAQIAGTTETTGNYGGFVNNLYKMAGSMYGRTSIGELMKTAKDNFSYTIAAGLANNPALYATMMAANMLQDLVGGIAIPTVYALGSGVDLKTTVAQIMQTGAMSASLLQGVATMLGAGTGGAGLGGVSGRQILNALGLTGGSMTTLGMGTSGSVYIGGGGSEVEQAALGSAEDKKLEISSENPDKADVTAATINDSIWAVHTLISQFMGEIKGYQQTGFKITQY